MAERINPVVKWAYEWRKTHPKGSREERNAAFKKACEEDEDLKRASIHYAFEELHRAAKKPLDN
jgi:hypothetical protein